MGRRSCKGLLQTIQSSYQTRHPNQRHQMGRLESEPTRRQFANSPSNIQRTNFDRSQTTKSAARSTISSEDIFLRTTFIINKRHLAWKPSQTHFRDRGINRQQCSTHTNRTSSSANRCSTTINQSPDHQSCLKSREDEFTARHIAECSRDSNTSARHQTQDRCTTTSMAQPTRNTNNG